MIASQRLYLKDTVVSVTDDHSHPFNEHRYQYNESAWMPTGETRGCGYSTRSKTATIWAGSGVVGLPSKSHKKSVIASAR